MSDSEADDVSVVSLESALSLASSADGTWEEEADETEEVLSKTYGKITVQLVKGCIETEETDVIVNTTAPDLKLEKGVASQKLMNAAGSDVQKDLTDTYKDGIKEGDIAKSVPGDLECKQIYHITMEKKKRDGPKTAGNYVRSCLSEADKSGFTSISFPALGTGRLGYNKLEVAEAMFSAVEQYNNNTNTNIDTVRIVIHKPDTRTLKEFESVAKQESIDTSARTVRILTLGRTKVKLKVGELQKQKTDVIVATSTRGLKLDKGSLSKIILQAAGPNLQKECDEKYPRGIQHGEVAELGPGNCTCKKILLGSVPRLDKNTTTGAAPVESISSMVTKCLEVCEANNLKSVSFPSLGTGNLNYPPTMSAHYMLEAVIRYLHNNPATVVRAIKILIHHSSVAKNLKPFDIEMEAKSKSWATKTPVSVPSRNTCDFCVYMYKLEVTPPSYWTKFTDKQSVKEWKSNQKELIVIEDVDQATFDAIVTLVQHSWVDKHVGHGYDAKGLADLKFTKIKVTKVQRVENLNLLESYGHRRQELFHIASRDSGSLANNSDLTHGLSKTDRLINSEWSSRLYKEVNEMYLFHGTKSNKIDACCRQGLDSKMGNGKAVFGQAIYLAESSTKADQYTDDKDNRRKKNLQMLLVRATLGRMYQTEETKRLKRPPCMEDDCKSDDCAHDSRFHSVVEEKRFIFREFIVYENCHVYPEYIITYDRV